MNDDIIRYKVRCENEWCNGPENLGEVSKIDKTRRCTTCNRLVDYIIIGDQIYE